MLFDCPIETEAGETHGVLSVLVSNGLEKDVQNELLFGVHIENEQRSGIRPVFVTSSLDRLKIPMRQEVSLSTPTFNNVR